MQEIYEEAVSLQKNGEYSRAIDLFLQMIEAEKENHSILNLIGMSYYALSDFVKAEHYLLQAYKVESSIVEYPGNLGILYLALGEYEKAYESLNLALEINESYISALISLSDVQIRLGDLESAKETVLKALSYDQNNIYVNKKAASLNRILGNNQQAMAHYNQILHYFPEDLESLFRLAEIYIDMGIYNEALKLYQQVFEIEPAFKNDLFLKGSLHQIYNKLFPANRFEFYNDKAKIKKIKELLIATGLENKTVVEVKGVEGLLSMICAKEGADVTMIHDEPFFIEKAKVIAKANNLENNLGFVEKETAFIDTNDINKEVDLIISNLHESFLPQYEYMINLYNFQNKFLAPNGKVFPEKLIMKAHLIESNEVWAKGSVDSVEGIDMSALNYYRSMYQYEDTSKIEHSVLSKTFELCGFDLYSTPKQTLKGEFTLDIENEGTVHGIAFWITKEFEGEKIDDCPEKQFIYLFNKSRKVKKNEKVTLEFIYSSVAMFFLK